MKKQKRFFAVIMTVIMAVTCAPPTGVLGEESVSSGEEYSSEEVSEAILTEDSAILTSESGESTETESDPAIYPLGDWQGTIFGDGAIDTDTVTNHDLDIMGIVADSDTDVHMYVTGNKGKIAASSEGMAFYYQPVSADEDFTLSATVTVNSFDANNQVGFGLRMADKLIENNTKPSSAADYGSSVTVGGYRLQSGGALGYARPSEGTPVLSANSTASYNNAASAFESSKTWEAGDVVDLSMTYSAYDGLVTLTMGDETSTMALEDLGIASDSSFSDVNVTFEDEIYVGVYAARNCDVYFSDLELTAGSETYEAGVWQEGYSYSATDGKWTVTPDDYDNPTTVSFERSGDTNGKLSDYDEEYPYFVSSIDENADFTLSATVTVDSMNQSVGSANQTAFGIVFRSTIDTSDSSYSSSTSSSNRHSPSIMLHFVSATKTTTDGTDLTGVNARYLTKSASSASYINMYNTEAGYISAGQTYDISLSKSGTYYIFNVTDNQTGESYSTSLNNSNVFSGTIYPGFFAARAVNVTYSDINLSVDNNVIKSIEVTTPPTQTEYYLGEDFNSEGMVVTATYADGSTKAIDDYIVSFDSSELGDTVVTVVKGSAVATTPVTVRKIYVTGITLNSEPLINRYYEYQTFTCDGIEGTITFENGQTEEISTDNVEYTVEGSVIDTSKYWLSGDAGSKTVYVSYIDTDTAAGNGTEAKYNITVYPYTLTGISVTSEPYKVTYTIGDSFVSDGLQISGIYSDGTNTYSDILSADTYGLFGFSSKTTGSRKITVTLNENTDMTTTFGYTVESLSISDCRITHYPRTSYVNGTDVSEIKSEFLNNMVITIIYSNDTEADLSSDEFTVDTSGVDTSENGTYAVNINTYDSDLPEFTVYITVWDSKNFYWKSVVFGSSSQGSGGSSGSSVTLVNTDENGLAESAYIASNNGSGKVTSSYHDGIAYYYTRINADNNFTVSGDIEVESYMPDGTNTGRQGQEAFGIMARDVIPLTPAADYSSSSSTYEDLGTSTVVLEENAAVDDNGEPVPYSTRSDFYSDIVIAGGYVYETYGTPSNPPTERQIARANSNRIKLFIRQGVKAWDGSDVSGASNEIYTIYDGSEFDDYLTTYEELSSGECFYPKEGDIYHIELTRLNNGYYAETTVLAVGEGNADYADTVVGLTFSKAWEYSEEDPLTVQNSNTIYAGFFAARYAEINVENIAVYESSKDTDSNTAGSSESVETPSLSLKSSLYTYDTDYSLILAADNTYGGNVIIKAGDEVVANGAHVGTENTVFGITLEPNTANDIVILYTPSTQGALSSYDTITYRYTLYCLSSASSESTIYAAPEEGSGVSDSGVYGTFYNSGTADSPLNLETALAVVGEGQTIVLLNGTYYRDSAIEITETNYGTKNGYKTLKAETDGGVTIDMQRSDAGILIEGDYWHIKGIKFLNSAVNCNGGALSGSHCIVEGCVFAESGATGFQISGSGSDEFDLWPSDNLIIYCESYNSCAGSTGMADGFGCKMAAGNGNIFKNCVAHNNEDDGWDLYAGSSYGPIGAVLLEDCISYDDSYYLVTEDNIGGDLLNTSQSNLIYGSSAISKSSVSIGDRFLYQSASGSGNGFKLGSENIYVQHYIKDSFAFGNRAMGFSSNSNPAMKVRNCISYNNGSWEQAVYDWGFIWSLSKEPTTAENYGLYSSVSDKVYNYNIGGAISAAASQYDRVYSWSDETDGTNQADSADTLSELYNTAQSTDSSSAPLLTINRNLKAVSVESKTNYLVKSTSELEKTEWGISRDGFTVTGYAGSNSKGEEVTPEWFVSLNESDAIGSDGFIISHEAGGSYSLGSFLKLTPDHIYLYSTADIPDYGDTYDLVVEEVSQQGDIDGDGTVDLTDAISIIKYVNDDDVAFTKTQRKLADINGDGEIDIKDAVLALKKAILNA